MSNTMDDSPSPATVDKPSRHLFWPILLTSLISIHVVSVVVMVIVATHDRSFAIEPDWYLKGLNYERTSRQQRDNTRLGWSVQLDVGEPLAGTHRRNVTCKVLDREGKPVENATVDLLAFAHLHASPAIDRPPNLLLPRKSGEYAATLNFEDPGMWEFRLVIKRGRETFTQIMKREI